MAKTYYSVPDKAGGDIFTEAMWDDYLKTNINNLRVPAGCAGSASGTATRGSSQLLAHQTQVYDTDAMLTISATALDVNTSGVYAISWYFQVAVAMEIICTIRDGTTSDPIIGGNVSDSANGLSCSANAVWAFTAGDTITFDYYLGGAGSVAYESRFCAQWVGQVS